MPLTSHNVNPRTGCWTPQESTRTELFERSRGPVTPDMTLDPICGNDECGNPDHIRPTRHAVAESTPESAPEVPDWIQFTPVGKTEPAEPVKRRPGRPRKNQS